MKDRDKKRDVKVVIINQIKLMVFLFLSFLISTIIILIINYIFQYLELPTIFLDLGLEDTILFVITFLLIPIYLIYNLVTLIPYFKQIKYNFYFIFLSIFIFIFIPSYIIASISDHISFLLASGKSGIDYADAVEGFGIVAFVLLYPLQYILVVLIVGWIFRKYMKKKK